MCSNFIDEIVLCESCSEAFESEKFVAAQTEKLERPNSTMVVEDQAAEKFNSPATRKNPSKAIQWAVVIVSGCIISAQLFFYSNPPLVEQQPSAIAKELQLSSLVKCMLLFREIGLILQDGRMPESDMLCADSDAANVLVNEGGNIRFYHPNPQHYGYEEISVGNTDAEPRIVLAEQ
ncbi:hypothetical protein COB72_11385 [bacterium]|nr:MAG: hypothetical protein COB72_11385 [bacterium]